MIDADKLSRLRAMTEPDQKTWDLSPNDVDALRTLLAAYDAACRERDRLREACRLIVSGWGHQDGVSRAVEAARAALGEK